MDYSIKTGNPEQHRTACVVAGVFQSRKLSEAAQQLDAASGGHLGALVKRGDMDGEAGQTAMLYDVPGTACERVLLVGCGPEKSFDATTYRKAHNAMAQRLKASGATDAVSCLAALPLDGRDAGWRVRQAIVAIEDTLYVFDQMKSKADDKPGKPLRKLGFNLGPGRTPAAAKRALTEGAAIAAGMALAKDLGNLPGNVCTPSYLAERARELKKGNRHLKVNVIDEAEMERQGMGALLSVSRGSEQPAKLITLEYTGADKKTKPIALVGKGITFDTGGISIKPGAAMDEMKFDMCGAASVLGTVKACAAMELPINVVGIVASAENMPGGRATKPGDIVTSLSGQTVEILNTDAEGRLVLCDALTYAERYEPQAVIDIATLTGACIVALGHHPSGLLSNHDPLATALVDAGATSGDRTWQLPLWEDYQDLLKSNFADMANIGDRSAGTITAACFLWRFAKKFRWAHLDIAGVAWHSGANKGSTGRPVPLLSQYLMDKAGVR